MAQKRNPYGDDTPDCTTELSDGIEFTEEINEDKLLRKIDHHLLPAVGILYLLSFLDRSNGKLNAHDTIHSLHWSQSEMRVSKECSMISTLVSTNDFSVLLALY